MDDELNLDQEESSGLPEATEAELVAQETADQEDRGASQTEPDEQFEYETPDGKVVVLNKEQADAVQGLLDAEERAEQLKAELEALKAKPAEEKPSEKPAQVPEGYEPIEPVEWGKVGENFQSMLEGENGGAEAIGPALHNVVLRTVATDPMIADLIGRYIDFRVSQREEGVKAETSFKEFVGGEVPETEVQAFQKANPWARTREAAITGLKYAQLQKEVAGLKAGKEAAHTEGKKVGEKEALIRAKARGTLRPLTGAKGGRTGTPGKTKFDLSDVEQRSAAMAEFINQRRASGKT